MHTGTIKVPRFQKNAITVMPTTIPQSVLPESEMLKAPTSKKANANSPSAVHGKRMVKPAFQTNRFASSRVAANLR